MSPGQAPDRRAWTDRGRPAEGYYTKRTAERWLADVPEQARRGMLPGMIRTVATFADAAEEFLRYIEHDRARKPSTIKGYRWLITARLLPAFGVRRLEDITTHDVEAWLGELSTFAPSSRTKMLGLLHGIFQRWRRAIGSERSAAGARSGGPAGRVDSGAKLRLRLRDRRCSLTSKRPWRRSRGPITARMTRARVASGSTGATFGWSG